MRNARVLLLLSGLLCACHATEAPSLEATHEPAAASSLSEGELQARIEQGRALLELGKPAEAEALFAEAAAADHDSLRTRAWVLRAWMDQGRSNDTLDALDALDRAGEKGIEMTYLYGMAFARRAQDQVASGISGSSVQMNFLSATDLLPKALEADPVRYRDAYLPLAASAWYAEKLETARWAADRAVEVNPSPEGWSTRGRILMAQFAAVEGEEPGSAEAEELWSAAVDSLTRAVQGLGDAPEGARRALLADAAMQLGNAELWRKRGPEATEAYALAAAAAPEAFDYGRALEFLRGAPKDPLDDRPNGFRAALEAANTRLEERAESSATLLWWLGWARFADASWAASEEAFQAALALQPGYTNAWFYIGLSRQYRKDPEGALQAMHTGWDADPATMVAAVAGAGGALRTFEALLAWCASEEPPRNLDAAFLAEMLAQAMPQETRHWNNVGLFLRDEGERLEIEAYKNKTPEPDPALLADLYGRSFQAYQRALELSPEDPQILNDTALMLDYHLDAEPAKVEAMYRRALELVEARLAAADLSEDDRARFEQTKKDIGVNLKALLEPDPEPEADAKGTPAATANAAAPQGHE